MTGGGGGCASTECNIVSEGESGRAKMHQRLPFLALARSAALKNVGPLQAAVVRPNQHRQAHS